MQHTPLLPALHPELAGFGAAEDARARSAQVAPLRMQPCADAQLPGLRQHQHAVAGANHLHMATLAPCTPKVHHTL